MVTNLLVFKNSARTFDIFLISPRRHEMSSRDLNQISIERNISKTSQKHLKRCLFCDVFKTSQIHLKKYIFFVTSLRRLKIIFKRRRLYDVFKTSRTYLSKKMSFSWRLWDVSKTSLASIFGFPKIRHKNDFVWFP